MSKSVYVTVHSYLNGGDKMGFLTPLCITMQGVWQELFIIENSVAHLR
jgi:hypothetical protein